MEKSLDRGPGFLLKLLELTEVIGQPDLLQNGQSFLAAHPFFQPQRFQNSYDRQSDFGRLSGHCLFIPEEGNRVVKNGIGLAVADF